MVIVGGGVMQAGHLLFDTLRKTVEKRAFSISVRAVKIVPSALGKDCTVIGAGSLVIEEIFKNIGAGIFPY